MRPFESMSMVAMGGNKPIAYPGLMNNMPNAYAAMGTTAEVRVGGLDDPAVALDAAFEALVPG